MSAGDYWHSAAANEVKVGDTLRHPEGRLKITAVKVSGERGMVVKLTGLFPDGREFAWPMFADRRVEVVSP